MERSGRLFQGIAMPLIHVAALSACLTGNSDADALADGIIERATKLAHTATRTELVHQLRDRNAIVVISPSGEMFDRSILEYGLDPEQREVLRQIRSRNGSDDVLLVVLSSDHWSAVSYLGQHIEVNQGFIVSPKDGVVHVTLERGNRRPIIASVW